MEIHLIENNELSQMHRDTHAKVFQFDLNFTFSLLCRGRRLTDKILMQEFGISGRRLRELYAEREQIRKKSGWIIDKEWIRDANQKTKWVEYFAKHPYPPSKLSLHAQHNLQLAEKSLITVFELEDNPKETPRYVSQTLFP